MEILVIDDGINKELHSIGHLKHDLEVSPRLIIKRRATGTVQHSTHGTTCAGIIRKYAPDAKFSSIKVLDTGSKKGVIRQLLIALEWCMINFHRIIHLSIGCEDILYMDPVRSKVCSLVKLGSIIVAASSNSGRYTLPANLSSVIEVKTNDAYRNNYYTVEEPTFCGTSFVAAGVHELENGFTTSSCNSYAAPLITAHVFNYLACSTGIRSVNQVKRHLADSAGVLIKNRFFINTMPDFLEKPLLIDMEANTSGNMPAIVGTTPVDMVVANPTASSEELLVNYLKSNRKAISGVLYEGMLSKKLRNLIYALGCLLWEETAYTNMIKESIRPYKDRTCSVVPIISILGDCLLEFTQSLKNAMIASGYHCGIVSNQKHLLNCDFIYLPPKVSLKEFLCYLEEKKLYDIILIQEISEDISAISDLEVTVLRNDFFVSITGDENTIDISCENLLAGIDRLIPLIETMLKCHNHSHDVALVGR